MNFKLEFIKTITNDFSEENKVGSGGYGDVYWGFYESEKIAVKRFKHLLGIDDKEFENEFHNLRKVQHENVVKLVGFCHETTKKVVKHQGKEILAPSTERILCFEFMQGGTLVDCIADNSCNLDWPTCYNIIKGICEGINHLHTAYKIFHLDIKPDNILLDSNKNAKLADLGLSRLVTKKTFVTKTSKGTPGYMPPEFVRSRCISNKYDVFSLGVVILNVMDGMKAWTRCTEMRSAGQFVNHKLEKKKLTEKLDDPSQKTGSLLQVKTCVELALKCVQHDRNKRPSTKDVVDELVLLDAKIKELPLASDDERVGQGLDALALHSSSEELTYQLPSPEMLLNSISGPGQLDVVILYAFDCSDWTSAWYTVEAVYWIVQEKLIYYIDSCLGYIYFMMNGNRYTSDMKLVDQSETEAQSYRSFDRRRVACTNNMASGIAEAHNMISNRGYPNGIILLFSDGLVHKGDFFDGSENFPSQVPIHTFTLGGADYNEGLRAIAKKSPGGKFHTTPVPERPTLSTRFSLLLDSIFDRSTIEDEESPSPSSEKQPLDVVVVYAFDCSEYTADWNRMDGTIFWMVQERLTCLEDSCMGYIYPMLSKNNYTSDMKLVDYAETKETGYKAFARHRLTCTKNMASGLAEAHKMLRNRGHQNDIILFFSDGLKNEGGFFDGTEDFKSKFPVHTFTLGGIAYNQGLEAIARKSPGGNFYSDPVPDRPEMSASFSKILDSLLFGK